jgi:murein DD-endopeptidase MepM/ murein hydrolase activator NlpD
LETLYGHNSRILVRAGDAVTEGQPIAEVGNTGLSSGPHLHFEIRWYGRSVDPTAVFTSLQ